MAKRGKKLRKCKKVYRGTESSKKDGDAVLGDFSSIKNRSKITFEGSTDSRSGSSGTGSRYSRSGSINISEELQQILNSTLCYHPKCSFAFNITQENLEKASLITECVPTGVYRRLAALWNLDPDLTPRKHGNECRRKPAEIEEENRQLEEYLKNVERDIGIRREVSEDMQLNAESVRKRQEKTATIKDNHKDNPYLKFLRKNKGSNFQTEVRQNLPKAATKITTLIIKNFLDWYQTLGGNDGEILIDYSTLEELFQIGFELPESKALAMMIKELPTVPECLAQLTNEPKHAMRHALKEFLQQDIIKEKLPLKMMAFGSMLPKEYPPLRYKPPRNFVQKTWMECQRVKSDLDTMKTIWEGMEKLRSTVAFANWLKNHPEITPPGYLQSKGLLKIDYDEWNQMYKGFEVEVDPTDMPGSDTKSDLEKELTVQTKLSDKSSEKVGSTISF